MSYQASDYYGSARAAHNDRAIYEDFIARQQRMKDNYAGKGSNNQNSAMNYDMKSGFEKFKHVDHKPNQNRFNVFERQGQI